MATMTADHDEIGVLGLRSALDLVFGATEDQVPVGFRNTNACRKLRQM